MMSVARRIAKRVPFAVPLYRKVMGQPARTQMASRVTAPVYIENCYTGSTTAAAGEKIRAAKIHLAPFPHMVIEGLLPRSFYNDLMLAFPERGEMNASSEFYSLVHLSSSSGIGDRYNLHGRIGGDLQMSPEFSERHTILDADPWRSFEDIVRDEIIPALWERFEPFTRRSLDGLLGLGWEGRVPSFVPAYRSGDLVRSHGAFVLPPHTDNRWYAITFILYMPDDGTRPDLGTSLFALDDRSVISPQYAETLREVARAPFKPNTLLAFANSPNSFHSSPLSGDYERRLYLNYLTPSARDAISIFGARGKG